MHTPPPNSVARIKRLSGLHEPIGNLNRQNYSTSKLPGVIPGSGYKTPVESKNNNFRSYLVSKSSAPKPHSNLNVVNQDLSAGKSSSMFRSLLRNNNPNDSKKNII